MAVIRVPATTASAASSSIVVIIVSGVIISRLVIVLVAAIVVATSSAATAASTSDLSDYALRLLQLVQSVLVELIPPRLHFLLLLLHPAKKQPATSAQVTCCSTTTIYLGKTPRRPYADQNEWRELELEGQSPSHRKISKMRIK
ncbi:uncharacterized protein G2W53_035934 [Senna tora]|uniref:Uncharacterized protein n=1 Tax=Senna tora TaxID=362788 RepID=A0A834SU08_9FABA|nr:uncharacterized protein G2W53_035934 [Senna tora]